MTNDDQTKGRGKIGIFAYPRPLQGWREYFWSWQTRFNGVLTRNSLDMHKNDKL